MFHEGKCNIPSTPIADGDGAVTARYHRFGEQLQTRFWPDHAAPTYRKYNFHSCTGSVTIGASHTSPCTANTGTPIHGFWNPPNSGVHVHIVKHSVAVMSATTLAGPLVWNHFINQTISAAPNNTPICGFIGGAACRSLWFTNTALTGCTTGTLFKHAWRITGSSAITYGDGPANELDDGDILIPPGSAFGLFAVATGSAVQVQSSITFAEYPV